MTKSTSATFNAAEEAVVRKPVELYRFWTDSGAVDLKYTSGDVDVVYSGATYTAAKISRGKSGKDIELNVSKLSITIDQADDLVKDYVLNVEPEPVWIEVGKLHRDMNPLEKDVIFIGQLRKPYFDGLQARIDCVGFEFFLSQQIPKFRYQPMCNYQVYSTGCGLATSNWVTAATVTSASGTSIGTSPLGVADGYFNLGWVSFNNHKRLITAHASDILIVRFPIAGLTTDDPIRIFPGCDKKLGTCRDKFGNFNSGALDRFLGMPFIPKDNPTTWM